jgi:hypothetical protein
MKRDLSWGRWGAIYVLLALYLFFWVSYWFTSRATVKQEAEYHGKPYAVSDVWVRWWDGTSENKMSEAWIGFTAALLIESNRARRRRAGFMNDD